MLFGTLLLDKAADHAPKINADSPEWVPETAVYRYTENIWINTQPAKNGEENKFICAIYHGEPTTAPVPAHYQGYASSPGLETEGTFILDDAVTDVERVRRLVRFYDGYEIYLKDGRRMYPDNN